MKTTCKNKLLITLFVLFSLIFAFNTNAQILSYDTKIKIDGGIKITENAYRIQVNSKEENYLSKIKISHNPNQKFTLISAKIIDAQGETLRKLKKKDIITKNDLSYGTFYQDGLIEEFNLYWNEYPYQIEYSYTLSTTEFIYITSWYPVVYTTIPTIKSSLQIELPIDFRIAKKCPDTIQYEEFYLEDTHILKWKVGKYQAMRREIYAPPLEELIPNIAVMALDFNYGIEGSSDTWASFGSWLKMLNTATDVLPISEKIVVDKLIAGVENKKEIIKILYHHLQDKTKYVNVAIDVGGLKSYPASYVCDNKYGDCKALTTYMKAMLNYVGIKSFYMIINAGDNAARIDSNFPSQQFNHVILSIPLGTDTVWLENTSNISPFNYLGEFTQNRYSLVVDKQNSKLVRTPVLEDTLLLEKRIYNFSLDAQGNGVASIKKTLGGESFERYRYFKTQLSLKDQDERLKKEYSTEDFELLEWDIVDRDRDSKNLKLFLEGSCKSQIRNVGSLKVISPLQIKLPKFQEPKTRKQKVRINTPLNKVDSVFYHLDFLDNYSVDMPPDINVSSAYGNYSAIYKQVDNSLVVYEYFKLNRGEYSIEEYPLFYAFIRSIIKHKKSSAILLK